jgi:hypothetical protein
MHIPIIEVKGFDDLIGTIANWKKKTTKSLW